MNDPQDPWEKFETLPDYPQNPPSVAPMLCIIVGAIITLCFACYGFYRIACWLVGLAP